MTFPRMDHVSVVVDDLDAAVAFFVELGLEQEARLPVRGEWVDRVNALDDVRIEIVMMRTPDGHGRLELTGFEHPAVVRPQPEDALGNVLGLRSVMFEVADVDATVERLGYHGGRLVGEVVDYERFYRLCYLRGPGGIIVSLAQSLR